MDPDFKVGSVSHSNPFRNELCPALSQIMILLRSQEKPNGHHMSPRKGNNHSNGSKILGVEAVGYLTEDNILYYQSSLCNISLTHFSN